MVENVSSVCVYIAFHETFFENLDVIASPFRTQLTDKVLGVEGKYFRICGVSRDLSSPLAYIFSCIFTPFSFFTCLTNILQVSGYTDKGSRHMAK